MHAFNYTYPYELFNERAIFFHVVESGVSSRQKYLRTQCSRAIRMKHIINIPILSFRQFSCVYHAMVFVGGYIHGTYR